MGLYCERQIPPQISNQPRRNNKVILNTFGQLASVEVKPSLTTNRNSATKRERRTDRKLERKREKEGWGREMYFKGGVVGSRLCAAAAVGGSVGAGGPWDRTPGAFGGCGRSCPCSEGRMELGSCTGRSFHCSCRVVAVAVAGWWEEWTRWEVASRAERAGHWAGSRSERGVPGASWWAGTELLPDPGTA